MADSLPHHMLPRYIEIRDEFPRSATGKIRKDMLKLSFDPARVWDRVERKISVRTLYETAGDDAQAGPA
ncbi:MAG: hypothetical protein IH603_24480 [Burkholderia vietnamiensis]|nr:hypothetical protein [Burkholderia vietnamiensis]